MRVTVRINSIKEGKTIMKPLHANVTTLRRCPCCQSKYSTSGARKTNAGKSAARQKDKRDLAKELRQGKFC